MKKKVATLLKIMKLSTIPDSWWVKNENYQIMNKREIERPLVKVVRALTLDKSCSHLKYEKEQNYAI